MEMIVVRRIIVGAEHGEKVLAGGIMNLVKETGFIGRAAPAIQHAYAPSVRKNESADIDGVGMGMFG